MRDLRKKQDWATGEEETEVEQEKLERKALMEQRQELMQNRRTELKKKKTLMKLLEEAKPEENIVMETEAGKWTWCAMARCLEMDVLQLGSRRS